MNEQSTLRNSVVFEGVGLHTGKNAHVTVSPAPADSGLRFSIDGSPSFPALTSYVVDTRRATVIGIEGVTVSTVEHLLSGLVGAGIDNALIEVRGNEIPVLDGSALPFLLEFDRVGKTGQSLARRTMRPERFELRDNDAFILVEPQAGFAVDVSIDFRPPIGAQRFRGEITDTCYRNEIASARTFGYVEEVEALRAAGLAMGGTLDNAVVFSADGALQPLRFDDEPVRHKVLDLLGDFALLGVRLDAKVTAHKTGHRLHAAAVERLLTMVDAEAKTA